MRYLNKEKYLFCLESTRQIREFEFLLSNYKDNCMSKIIAASFNFLFSKLCGYFFYNIQFFKKKHEGPLHIIYLWLYFSTEFGSWALVPKTIWLNNSLMSYILLFAIPAIFIFTLFYHLIFFLI